MSSRGLARDHYSRELVRKEIVDYLKGRWVWRAPSKRPLGFTGLRGPFSSVPTFIGLHPVGVNPSTSSPPEGLARS